jgi:hypothetical protein
LVPTVQQKVMAALKPLASGAERVAMEAYGELDDPRALAEIGYVEKRLTG